MTYTVSNSKFHGGDVIYSGSSLKQAIRVARKNSCVGCKCGGPRVEDEKGRMLFNWEATKPFQPANEPWWEIV